MGYMQDELFDARKIMQRLDSLRSLVLVSLAALLLWFSVNKTLKSNLVIALLVLLMIGDLWQIGKRYIATDKFTSISMIMDVSSPNDYQNSIHTIKELG
jgi:Flp pilus assembly protein TadB